MKKVILVIAVCMGVICCKQKIDGPDKGDVGKKDLESLVLKGKITGPQLIQLATTSTTFSTVVIKTSDATTTWRALTNPNGLTNGNLIYKEYSDYCYINIGLIKYGKDQATWLKDNEKIIDYEKTKPYVEHAHRLYFPELIPDLYDLKDSAYKNVTVADLLAEIGTSINYPNYINFDISGPKAEPKKETLYTSGSPDPDLFSATLLTSLIKTNGLMPADTIGVALVPQVPHSFTCLKVFKTGAIYNYSNEPR